MARTSLQAVANTKLGVDQNKVTLGELGFGKSAHGGFEMSGVDQILVL